MEATADVIVQHGPSRGEYWRRFAAAMCLVLFYYHFVEFGKMIWDPGAIWFDNAASRHPYIPIAGFVTTIMLYVAARFLWTGRFLPRVWLCLLIVCILTIRILKAAQADWAYYYYGPFTQFQPVNLKLPASFLVSLSRDAPWLLMLIAGLWCCWDSYRKRERKRPVWVWMALAWSLGGSAVLFIHNPIMPDFEDALLKVRLKEFALPCTLLLPIATVVLLFTGQKFARSTSLTFAGIQIGLGVFGAIIWTRLVHIAIVALFASSIEPYDWYIYPLPLGIPYLNQSFFDSVFVDLVYVAGPWLVIAVFAWRAPLGMPAEDGLPYPRRYCGHCHYNLRGISSERCPECGRVLVGEE